MPYIVTTTRRIGYASCHELGVQPIYGEPTRHAVATLHEARDTITAAHPHAAWSLWDDVFGRDAGGTVGPLPDGTVIDVKCVPLSSPFADAGAWCDIYNRNHGVPA